MHLKYQWYNANSYEITVCSQLVLYSALNVYNS